MSQEPQDRSHVELRVAPEAEAIVRYLDEHFELDPPTRRMVHVAVVKAMSTGVDIGIAEAVAQLVEAGLENITLTREERHDSWDELFAGYDEHRGPDA